MRHRGVRIGFDVTSFAFGIHAGIAVYQRRLLQALLAVDASTRLVLLHQQRRSAGVDVVLEELVALDPARVAVRYGGWRTTRLPVRGGAWMPWQPGVRTLVGEVDVYHAGDGAFPPRGGTPIVATIYDLTTQLFPRYHTFLNRRHDRRRLRWLARNAVRVMTISEATRRDLATIEPELAARADVTLLASGAGAAPPREDRARRLADLRVARGLRDDPYLLSVGTLEPRKNHVALVHALATVAPEHPRLRLVLAGRPGWKSAALLRAVAASPVRDRIHLLGAVTADELAALYEGAHAFAYPSRYEGFGLPVLEAMAAGVPVLTSAASSLTEVAGDAALLVDPDDQRGIADGLRRLLADEQLRRELSAKGRARASTFSWARTARQTLDTYRRALARG